MRSPVRRCPGVVNPDGNRVRGYRSILSFQKDFGHPICGGPFDICCGFFEDRSNLIEIGGAWDLDADTQTVERIDARETDS